MNSQSITNLESWSACIEPWAMLWLLDEMAGWPGWPTREECETIGRAYNELAERTHRMVRESQQSADRQLRMLCDLIRRMAALPECAAEGATVPGNAEENYEQQL